MFSVWRLVCRVNLLSAVLATGLIATGTFKSDPVLAAETGVLRSPPLVLTTIKPLHSLASVVTEGVSEARNLINSNASPHTFQFRPSHIRAVADADIILWAGEGVERFLPSMIGNFAKDAKVIEAAAVDGMVRHHSRHRESGHGLGQQPDRADLDYHLWLDPENAMLIVERLAVELSLLDPLNAEKYHHNAEIYMLKLADVKTNIQQLLRQARGKRYLVYHDSMQYFEKAFGLGEAIVVTPQPQMQAGVRRLRTLHNEVAQWQPQCILAEVQFRAPVLRSLAEDLQLTSVTIDPLASRFEAGVSLYVDWLEDTAATIEKCFTSTVNQD